MTKKYYLLFLFVCVFPPPSYASCLKVIENNSFDRIWPECTRVETDNLFVIDTKGKHDFGSFHNMSLPAILLKNRAEEGSTIHQFFWSIVLDIYASEVLYFDVDLFKYLKQDSAYFSELSAEGGYIFAQYIFIKKFLDNIQPTHDEKEKALGYALELKLADHPEANDLMEQVTKKHVGNVELETYDEDIVNYHHLAADRLLELAYISRYGQLQIKRSREGQFPISTTINVRKDERKSIEIYLFLVEELRNTEAAYILAKWIGRNKKDRALSLYTFAAENGHASAAVWYGEYQACNGNKLNALVWFNRGVELGFGDPEYIDYIIAEIEELGVPVNCFDNWIS